MTDIHEGDEVRDRRSGRLATVRRIEQRPDGETLAFLDHHGETPTPDGKPVDINDIELMP